MHYYIIIPAYNEEEAILPCLKSIAKATEFAQRKGFFLQSAYICVNGCTDNTEKQVEKAQKNIPQLKIRKLSSSKGMVRALSKIIEILPDSNYPIVKVDADTIIKEDALYRLLNELRRHPQLKIVGGSPEALLYKGRNYYKRLLSNILDIRSRYPLSQVAVHKVDAFHKIAKLDPQPTIPVSFEERSRIYFHGRFYALRNKSIWDVPLHQMGDDTYLTLSVYKRFGLGSIRIRYDAVCYYYPTVSLRYHYKVYKRNHCNVKGLFKLPEFKDLKEFKKLEAVKLDWSYIKTLAWKIRFYFLCYALVKFVETILFNITPDCSQKIWSYRRKYTLQQP